MNVFGLRFEPAVLEELILSGLRHLPDARDPREAAVILTAMGVPALVAALVLATARPVRVLPLAALAPVALAVVFFSHLRSHDPLDCHDCYAALGGAYHPVELGGTILNVAAWTLGTGLGLLLGRLARGPATPSGARAA